MFETLKQGWNALAQADRNVAKATSVFGAAMPALWLLTNPTPLAAILFPAIAGPLLGMWVFHSTDPRPKEPSAKTLVCMTASLTFGMLVGLAGAKIAGLSIPTQQAQAAQSVQVAAQPR